MPNTTITSTCDQTLYFDGKPFAFKKGEKVVLPDNIANFFAGKSDVRIERGRAAAAPTVPRASRQPPSAPPAATTEPPPPVEQPPSVPKATEGRPEAQADGKKADGKK